MTIQRCFCHTHNARTRIVPSNPLKADPTRSKTLRRVFETALMKRFRKLNRAIFDLVVTEDAFGLKQRQPFSFNQEQNDDTLGNARGNREESREVTIGSKKNRRENRQTLSTRRRSRVQRLRENNFSVIQNQRFAFQSTPQQVASFRQWLEGQIVTDIIPSGANIGDEGYWQRFVEEGYRKGQGRAFTDSRPAATTSGNLEQLAFYEGTKAEFLASSFGSPVAVEKVQLLAGRVFTELQGVTQAMAQGITRELTEGLSRGESPFVIARRMQDEIRGIGMRRATLIARTEITRAHAEGQLDAMERLGVEKVGVAVEWSTAGDDRVCPLCQPLEGVVMSLKEARGIIPRHPQCRCAFVPANVGESQEKQIRTKGKIDSALDKSIGQERPKFKTKVVPGRFTPTGRPVRRRVGLSQETIKQAKRKSAWRGSDTKVSKKRPKGIL